MARFGLYLLALLFLAVCIHTTSAGLSFSHGYRHFGRFKDYQDYINSRRTYSGYYIDRNASGMQFGDFRIVPMNDCPHEGRLEYLHSGQWGTVCNDMFNTYAAKLACQTMNYTQGIFLSGVTFPGVGRIWIDNLQCLASHRNISQCSHSSIGRHDCTHSEDVVVACFNGTKREFCPGSEVHDVDEGALRLKDGSCTSEGRLEIFHGNSWGTICDDGFGEPEAFLACRQLGFDSGVTIRAPRPGVGPIWLDDLACNLQHSSLAECGGSRWGREDCSHSEDVGVHCYNESATVDCHGDPVPLEGGLRIIDGECPFSGRLEIWHAHRWGTICHQGFNSSAAAVACKQLGYTYGWLHTAPPADSSTHIWVKNFRCQGDEANITSCDHDTWGSTYGCGHEHDAGVLCSNNERRDCSGDLINHEEGKIRLVGSNCSAYGLLEIYHLGRWGTVCDDSFTDVAASVACKQMGYKDGFIKPPPAPGTGITWLDNVQCSAHHTRITDCPHAPWGVEDCGHSEDIGLQCFNGTGSLDCDGIPYPEEGKLRLISGNCSHTGRLEIFHAGRWGSICDIGFDDVEVQLACKQLGYKRGFLGTVSSYGPLSTRPLHAVWIKGLNCGTEHSRIDECPRTGGWGNTGCDFNQDVFLTCSNTESAQDCQGNAVQFIEGQLRLSEGQNSSSGRLEIFHSGRWGSICDDSFGSVDATVACRELGFHRGQLGSRSLAPDGRGPTWLDEMGCLPSDTKLALCSHHPWGREDCGNSEDVRLLCSNETECSSNPCQNNAKCKDGFNSFSCECLAGFQGITCQFNIDECAGNPCRNGATCIDGINDYNCTCLKGYVGKNCSEDFNDCNSNPCQNGATCKDFLNRYECECAAGYTGTLCETNIRECDSYPCQNDGVCSDLVNDFKCDCKPGFKGKVCQTNINECAQKPCKNNGTCLDGNNWYICVCPTGFVGKNCELVAEYKTHIAPQANGGAPESKGSDGSAKGIAAVAICIAIIVLIVLIVLVVRMSRRFTRTNSSWATDKRANIRWKMVSGRARGSDDGREDEVAVWNGSSDKVNLVA